MLSHAEVPAKELVNYAVVKPQPLSLNPQNKADEIPQRKNTEILAHCSLAFGGWQRGGSMGIRNVVGCAESYADDQDVAQKSISE